MRNGLEDGSLVSMSFSMLSMLLESVAFLRTTGKKQTNIIIPPDIEPAHSIYSISPLATRKMYTNCETELQLNDKKPKNTPSLIGFFGPNRFDGRMPKHNASELFEKVSFF